MAVLSKMEEGFTFSKEMETLAKEDKVYYVLPNLDIIAIHRKDLARAVANTPVGMDVVITDTEGNEIVTTIGHFLNRVYLPQDEKVSLINEVVKLQKKQKVTKVKYCNIFGGCL